MSNLYNFKRIQVVPQAKVYFGTLWWCSHYIERKKKT